MGASILFIAVLGVVAAWWLSRQRLTAKPWLEAGALGEFPGTGVSSVPAAKDGLGVFLAVVGSLFALFIGASLGPLAPDLPIGFSSLLLCLASLLLLGAALVTISSRARADANDLRT